MSKPHVEPIAAPHWSRPLGRCVGSGGFASVWEIASGGVLKLAHANHDLSRARLVREAEALKAIGAPAVPGLIEHGTLADGRAWIAMENIAGQNLADLISLGPIRIDEVVGLSIQILEALARIHEAKFAHRDLKPDNIVRRPDGSIVILDLGLARKLPDDPDDPNRTGVQVGSIEYMAPEQVLDATTAGAPADLYAFGCILYELCSGRPPFVGDTQTLERAHAALRPPPLGALAKVPAAIEQACHECLAKQPVRRPASARVVADQLRAVRDAQAHERAAERTQVSMISEGKQPVVLLWAELPRVDRSVVGVLAAHKVMVISQRGRRLLGGIVGADHADPAAVGIATARELVSAGARVALHLDAMRVTPDRGNVMLAGVSVERPETWLPAGAWTGIVMTSSVAAVSRTRTRATALGPGFVRVGESTEPDELFGRAAVISNLVDDATLAIEGARPGFTVVIGDPGVGKTALAGELAGKLVDAGARVCVGTITPPGSGRPDHSALESLVGTPAEPIVRSIGDALRAAARERPTVVILDDLHLAGHDLLDALEYATLGGEPVKLWVLGLAAPRLEQRRPDLGARAERHHRITLAALEEEAAVEMTAALLQPAAYPPLRALRRIAAIARGNPMHLVALTRELHERGAIRTRPNGERFFDPAALDALPPIALGPWLAARELRDLGPEVVALARVCAVLGGEIFDDEIVAVVNLVEASGGATTTVDVEVGLGELERAGILVGSSHRWSFRRALLEEGVYATTNGSERLALHAAALGYWRGRDNPTKVARHAEAVGDRTSAAAAFCALGDRAHANHRELDANQAWEGALRNLAETAPLLPRALLGRARARYRIQRRYEALEDLERVIELARRASDVALEVEALLEQATVQDWIGNFDQSRAIATEARARVLASAPSQLTLGVTLAELRSRYRAGGHGELAEPLRGVAASAAAESLFEIEIIARMLLGLVLVDTSVLDAAEVELGELLRLCELHDDKFHLASAYVNRARLWSARGLVERGAEDMRRVIQLAREGGQAQIERAATYNMAEDLLWQGSFDEALQLARRSLALQSGQGEGSAAVDRVLVARVLAARKARDELAEMLVAIANDQSAADELATEMGGQERAILAALEAVVQRASGEAWGAILTTATALPPSLRVEVALLAAGDGQLDATTRETVTALAATDPIFARRLSELS